MMRPESGVDQPTVLLFDSGVGGLSIYREIHRYLPGLQTIYAFDNAFFPYGEKPAQVVIGRVITIVEAICQSQPIDMLVVACNTASTVALPVLRRNLAIPVVGVVPAIKPAVKKTRNGIIGLLATRATVNRRYTQELIAKFAQDCQVILLGSAQLVEIAEGKLHGQAVDLATITDILQPWLTLSLPPDTIVLGCTHFPLLRAELSLVLPPDVVLVDSGDAVARRVVTLLGDSVKPIKQAANMAYCTREDEQTARLKTILINEGLVDLRRLVF